MSDEDERLESRYSALVAAAWELQQRAMFDQYDNDMNPAVLDAARALGALLDSEASDQGVSDG